MTAVIALVESAPPPLLAERMGDLVQTLSKAFELYQLNNVRILYDTVSMLSWRSGPELDKPEYVQALMTHIAQKFQSVQDTDITVLQLFECLTSLVQSIGKSIVSLLPQFVMRCIKISNDTAMAAKMWEQNPNEFERPDREIMAASIDLLAGIVDGLKERSREIVVAVNFLSVLPLALQDSSARVKQSGFWLLGTCAVNCPEPLAPVLPQLLPHCAGGLALSWQGRVSPNMTFTVASNAAWAVGEVCVRAPAEIMEQHLEAIVSALMALLQKRDIKPWQQPGFDHLLYTVCITINRLRERTALGGKWPSIYGQLPQDLRDRFQRMYGLTA